MRETLSLLRLHHWKKSLWNGHYLQLIKWWGWKCVFADTMKDILKLITKRRLHIAADNKGVANQN